MTSVQHVEIGKDTYIRMLCIFEAIQGSYLVTESVLASLAEAMFIMFGVVVLVFCMCSVSSEYMKDGGDSMVGDMLLTPHQHMFIETGIASRGTVNRPWPNNEVPYIIDGSAAGARGVIMSAMNEWSQKTCIRFIPRTSERGYIRFFAQKGCWSNVGYQGYEQRISLQAKGCWHHGIVVHEIGHALGFWHEQNRPDRDNYVTIHRQNIQPDKLSNFFKLHSTSTTTPYDYGSIMHYGAKDFSINGHVTIEVKTRGVSIGQRNGLSEIDVMQAQILFKCPAVDYPFERLICENGQHTLHCFGGRKIKITYAMYGRDNMLKCGFFPWSFCSSNRTGKAGSICNGKTRCTIRASNSVFGDPCRGAKKYLKLRFKCDPESV